MKKINYLIITFMLVLVGVTKVGATPVNPNFKDDNFYKCVIESYNKEFNTNYDINHNFTNSELNELKAIGCYYKGYWDISDTTGLDKMTNLETLYLDNSGSKAKGISVLDLSNNLNLKKLYINKSNFDSIDLSNNINLSELSLYNDKLTTLDLSKNTNLSRLSLSGNVLSILDLSNNNNLRYVGLIEENNIKKLVYPKNRNFIFFSSTHESIIFKTNNISYKDYFDEIRKYLKINDMNNYRIFNESTELKDTDLIKTGDWMPKQGDFPLISIKGDLNGDGKLTFLDITKAYKIYKEKEKPESYVIRAGCVTNNKYEFLRDRDLKIEYTDITKLYKVYKEKDTF